MIRPEALFAGPQSGTSMDDPLAHLKACHRRIEERLATLERASSVLGIMPQEARAAMESVFRFLDTSGVLHTADEEESLFPRLRPLLEPGERTYLAGLEHDHTEAHRIYAELKRSLGDVRKAQGLVDRFCELYRRHIASEDEALQEYAKRLLTESHLAEISEEMKRRRAV